MLAWLNVRSKVGHSRSFSGDLWFKQSGLPTFGKRGAGNDTLQERVGSGG